MHRGTFIACELLSEFAVVGADSRTLDDFDKPSDYCKILPLSDHVFFFSAGLGGVETAPGQRTFDINQSAHRAFVQSGLSSDPAIIAKIFERQLLLELTEMTKRTGATFETGNNGLVVQASFVGGQTTLSETNIVFKLTADNVYQATANTFMPPQFTTSGYQDILRAHMSAADAEAIRTSADRLKINSDLRAFEDNEAAIIERMVRIVVDHSGDKLIGGEPAVAVFDRNTSFRWFRRPPICPER